MTLQSPGHAGPGCLIDLHAHGDNIRELCSNECKKNIKEQSKDVNMSPVGLGNNTLIILFSISYDLELHNVISIY